MTIGLLSFASIAAPTNPLQSQRNVLNVNFSYANDYAYINHILKTGIQPSNEAYWTTTAPWAANIDSNGYPADNAVGVGHTWQTSVQIPGDGNYTGFYILTFSGEGRVFLQNDCTYTQSTDPQYTNTYGVVSSTQFDTVTGHAFKLAVQISSGQPNPKNISISFGQKTGGVRITNIKFYRVGDEADLVAGKIYRTGFKQPIVNLCPSALRFMNWHGGNNIQAIRFENRNLPGRSFIEADYVTSPVYATQATGNNTIAVAAASPTASNAKTTPTSMQHGEVCTFLMPSGGLVRATAINMTAATNANPCVVTVPAHGRNVGDKVIHINVVGMTQLNRRVCTISAVTTNTYTINVDSTAFGSFVFSANSSANVAQPYVSLQVGTGSDRTAYPMMTIDGSFSMDSSSAPAVSTYVTAHFDKNISILDNVGNATFGIWCYQGTGNGFNTTDVPLEYMVALINELNAMGPARPINMWLNLPMKGLCTYTPSYNAGADASSRYAVNALNVVLNGSTANGGTWAGLTTQASVNLEKSNEIWLFGLPPTNYACVRALNRWNVSSNDYTSDYDLWTVADFVDIKNAFPGNARVKFTLGLGANKGYTTSPPTGNSDVVNGTYGGSTSSQYLTDSIVTGNGWGVPVSYCDALCLAPYITNGGAYFTTTTGTGCYTDDVAKFNGFNNTANSGGNYTGAANPSAAITGFVNANITPSNIENTTTHWSAPSVGIYAQVVANVIPSGKFLISYEGGLDWSTLDDGVTGSGALKLAVYNSPQWATAETQMFTDCAAISSKVTMPSLYTWIPFGNTNQRWCYCNPDSYASGTEGQALANNPLWAALCTKNQAIF